MLGSPCRGGTPNRREWDEKAGSSLRLELGARKALLPTSRSASALWASPAGRCRRLERGAGAPAGAFRKKKWPAFPSEDRKVFQTTRTQGPRERTGLVNGIGLTDTLGIDLGDKFSYVCALSGAGEVTSRFKLRTTAKAFKGRFSSRQANRVVIETGTHSPWVARLLEDCGHQVVVANARRVALISKNTKKTDREDCEILARLGRADPTLLSPIRHRSKDAQCDLAIVRARSAAVAARTQLINTTRGQVKSIGARLQGCPTTSFVKHARKQLPPELAPALAPLLELIEKLDATIKGYDKEIKRLCQKHKPTELLRAIAGVGPLVSLSFVLTVEDPHRFKNSRQVGAYFGLVPRLDESGQSKPQLRITKAGDVNVRCLLTTAAQYVLGPWGPDSDLRRWGLQLAERGAKNGKKRAVTAVARRLAVLMHHLWKTGEVYDPLYLARQRGEADDPTKARPARLRKPKAEPTPDMALALA